MNGNVALLNASAYEIVNLAVMTAYKCRAHRMDSMIHVRDNAPMVYSYTLDPMVDNANYHLKTGKNKLLLASIKTIFSFLCNETIQIDIYGSFLHNLNYSVLLVIS